MFKSRFMRVMVSLTVLFSIPAFSIDYRANKGTVSPDDGYRYDHVAQIALGLGKATKAFSSKEMQQIREALDSNRPVPAKLSNDWQKLVRMAQAASLVAEQPNFFPFGVEFETYNPKVWASDDFGSGAKAIGKLIEGTAGLKRSKIKEETALFVDEMKREWPLMKEYAREIDYGMKSGWELSSPPFMQPEELQHLASFAWKLGKSPYGQSNKMTGAHQTFNVIPKGEKADSALVARAAANAMLLQQQYLPTLYRLLDVKRWGGYENTYFRPFLFDHGDLLEKMSKADPATLDLPKLQQILLNASQKEFNIQVESSGNYDQESIDEMRKEWTQEQKKSLRENWKYRDLQIRFNQEKPERTLVETRIGDWVADRPERMLVQSYLYQRLLDKAYEMAKEGKIWDLKIPERKAEETDKQYWQRLETLSEMSEQSLFKTLEIDNPETARFLQGKSFQLQNPRFKAGDKMSFGFEIEGFNESLVNVILPRDPKLRKKWRGMTEKEKVHAMEKHGFDFSGDFTPEYHRVLTSEFVADFEKYPFMHPELHVEASGRWEIKSSGRGIYDAETLRQNLQSVAKKVGDGTGIHVHAFVPDSKLSYFAPEDKSRFADYLERASLMMALTGYADASAKDAYHALDSWSLDRYSPKDIERIKNHLNGREKLSGEDIKYHNIGYRPVKGGLDIEFRDLDDAVDFGTDLAKAVERAVNERDFGDREAHLDPTLFMEFRDHADLSEVEGFTLYGALKEKRALSGKEKELLRKLQFEIYKPSMEDFMHFHDYYAMNDVKDAELDTKWLRSNFENNQAIPLLNYDEQSFLSREQKETLRKGRDRFLERVEKTLKKVAGDKRYAFLGKTNDFLHLAEYLERSTHPTRPDFSLKPKKAEATRQRNLLEELTFEMRGHVVKFVQETGVDAMVRDSLKPRPAADSLKLPVGKPGCKDLLSHLSL